MKKCNNIIENTSDGTFYQKVVALSKHLQISYRNTKEWKDALWYKRCNVIIGNIFFPFHLIAQNKNKK